MYDSVDQAKLRLENTLVVYKDRFYKVAMVARAIDFRVGDPGDRSIMLRLDSNQVENREHVLLTDPDLIFRKYRMGYFNTTDGAYQMVRTPSRCQQQGICNANTRLLRVTHPPRSVERDGGSSPLYLAASGGMFTHQERTNKMAVGGLYRNIYPSLSEAKARLEDGDGSVAISRTVAVVHDPDLEQTYVHIRGFPVGILMGRQGLIIPPRLKFYREEASQFFPKITVDEEAA